MSTEERRMDRERTFLSVVQLATKIKSGETGSDNVNTRKHKWRENERC